MFASVDYSSIEELSKRLVESANAIGEMYERVAKARQAKEYDSDRKKRALSLGVHDHIKEGMSAAAAEHAARASDSYGELMKQIGKDLLTAELTIAEYEATKIKWETARSILSVHKHIAGNL